MDIQGAKDRTVLEGAPLVEELAAGLAIKEVLLDSLAEHLELKPGDTIESLNGQPVRDAIDFHYNFNDDQVTLRLVRGDDTLVFDIEKDPDEVLGVIFEDMSILKCDNKCVFCFLHQMPKKLRKTLYYQDDDYRLSFLHGAYVTLTNLSDEEFDRIVSQRLSPMYVSVHATDPDVRGHLLGRKGPIDVLGRLDYLISKGISIHTQVVYCPGINDGPWLDETISDLADRYPNVVSLGVVPLGLTKFRQNLPELTPVTETTCLRALEQIHAHQDRLIEEIGARFVYAGDEFYLQSGLPVPGPERYDGFPLVENGIGMVRRFLDDFEQRLPDMVASNVIDSVTLVTGALGEQFLRPMSGRLRAQGIETYVLPVTNEFLGHDITVSGLLAGEDILRALKSSPRLGDRIILPPNCVNHEGILLDDWTPEDLGCEVNKRVQVGSYSLIESIVGGTQRTPQVAAGMDHPYIASYQEP
ncbi:MAG TPA: hypothetical protein DHW45_10490 [Candidatus Latescibacteria bacterium]|nr:hypothetical protein [Candidatus Latescibacterota bacterium]